MNVDFQGVFKSMLIKQQMTSEKNVKQYADVLDMGIQDMYFNENRPLIETTGNWKFEIPAQIQDMEAYAGGGFIESAPDFTHSNVEVVELEGYFTIPHKTITAVVNKGSSALVSSTAAYLEGNKRSMRRAKSRQFRWDGTWISGVLPESVQWPTSEVLLSVRETWNYESRNIYGLWNRELPSGVWVTFWTSDELDAGTGIDARIISKKWENTIVLDRNVTVWKAASANNRSWTNADTVYLVRGKADKNEWKNVAMWIFWLIDDGTIHPVFQWITRANSEYMTSIVKEEADATNLITDIDNLIWEYSLINPNFKYLRASTDVYRKYRDLILLQSKTVATTQMVTKLDGGFTGLAYTYNGKEYAIIEDKYFPFGQLLAIDPVMYGEVETFADNYVNGYIMESVSGWITGTNGKKTPWYETLRANYFNYFTIGSRMCGARINYLIV